MGNAKLVRGDSRVVRPAQSGAGLSRPTLNSQLGRRWWRQGRAQSLSKGRWLLAVAASIIVALGIVAGAAAAPPVQSPEEGKKLFQQKCASCHTVGQGDPSAVLRAGLLGPDLVGVTQRREKAWLERWIAEPDQMLAEGDPTATELREQYNNVPMPNLGLTKDEVASIIAYLETAEGGPVAESPAEGVSGEQPAPLGQPFDQAQGDPVIGRSLFTGASRLQHGGPACRACHSISGIGALGGGSLGPDLTGAHQKLGDAMIAWPENVAPMRPIYTEKPLTEQEKAHLLAFFQAGPLGQRTTQAVWQLTGLAVAGAAVFLVAAAIIWRRRLSDVRRAMVSGGGR